MSTKLRDEADRSKLPEMVGAVIYVRVSTKEQTENLSLSTQLKACEEYCERQGFHVLARFREAGESAKTADRTELQKLLQFCRKNKGIVQFVVVFNLTRFAREKYDHFALRAHLKSLGISLRSATEPIDVPDFNVSRRGDFEALVTERVFFRVQAILDGRYEVTAPRQRNDPDFPLRGYIRCETCGKPLTASWSKGRSDYYAYYHCRGRCRAVNISKTKL